MSAPLRLTMEDLRQLAAGLQHLTNARVHNDVDIDPIGTAQVGVNGHTIGITWDPELEQYVVADRIGG